MPKAAEEAMRKEAQKRWPGNKERQDKYVYGGLRSQLGWKPDKEKKGKK